MCGSRTHVQAFHQSLIHVVGCVCRVKKRDAALKECMPDASSWCPDCRLAAMQHIAGAGNFCGKGCKDDMTRILAKRLLLLTAE